MKIKSLTVRNFKGARRIEIHADEVCNELVGDNGAGKSSVLDAIVAALAGARGMEAQPLTTGASNGEITLDLGDLVIERKLSARNQRPGVLTITAARGRKMGQRDLDGLFGSFTFDPLAFSRLRPAEQVQVVRQLAGADVCGRLDALDRALRDAEETRTEASRSLKRHGEPDRPVTARVEPVDTAALTAELTEIAAHNAEQTAIIQRAAHAEARIAELEEQLAAARDALEEIPLSEPMRDATAIEQQLSDASATNALAAEWEQYDAAAKMRRELERDHRHAQERVEDLRRERADVAAGAQLPIPGLAWADDGLRVEGLPFEQLSSAERLRLSVRIGMSVEPSPLRVMFLRDGSLLDGASFDTVRGLAAEHGYQLWVETVGAGHTGDVIEIVEGETAGEVAQ